LSLLSTFETKRMKFRFLEISDIDEVCRQFSDPDMCKYFSEPPCDLEEAKGIIEHYSNPYGKGYLRYGLFDKEAGSFIGTCGYHYLDTNLKQVEIGYDIWKDYWKQGYISEALPALINICFEQLGVDCVYILTHPENTASIASAGKFGFKECEPCRIEDATSKCMKLLCTEWYNK